MKILILVAALSLPVLADEKPLDTANKKMVEGQKSVKSGAKKAESDTNKGLEKARKKGRKGAKQAEKDANDAAKKFRQKVGTEK